MLSYDEILALRLAGKMSKAELEEAIAELAAWEWSANEYDPGTKAVEQIGVRGRERAGRFYVRLRVPKLRRKLYLAVKEATDGEPE